MTDVSTARPAAADDASAVMPTVDVHAHAILPTVDALVGEDPRLDAHLAEEARRNGEPSSKQNAVMVAERITQLTRLDRRLADMDAAGIDIQVVSASPSQYHYWADGPLADRLHRTANEAMAELVAQVPDRLTGLGLVPLQHPSAAVDLLDHALDCGLVGVEISSFAPTPEGGSIELSDPRLESLWARAEERAAVVFVHPFGCTLDRRLDRFYLANIVGQPLENAVALSHLVFSGVMDRYPDLRILAAHGGGYLPTYLGRSDHGWEVRPEARQCEHPPSTYLRRLRYDSLVHTPDAMRALVAVAGADRVLLGSDYPFDMGVTDPVERLLAAGLDPEDATAIRGGNALALGLDAPAHRSERTAR